jgi:3'-5' exoribonuclease
MLESFHPEKGPFLRGLPAGERFVGYYVVRARRLEPFRDPTRGMFLSLALADRSGQLPGRVWEDAERVAQEVAPGDVVKVEGETEEFQGRVQVRVLRLRRAEPGEYDLRDLLASSERDPDVMQAELQAAIEGIENPHLAALVKLLFGDEDFRQEFMQSPAAKRVHHAYRHGLMEHVLEMLAISDAVIPLYPGLDGDLLRAGILLHDMGKLREYAWDVDIDLTTEGRLVGHVQLTDAMLQDALRELPDFPEDLGLRLRHMLLAHPGRLEYGAARRPKTLEAAALHHIDNLSTQLNRFGTLLAARPPGEPWTDYVRGLGRSLYGGPEDDDLNPEEESQME